MGREITVNGIFLHAYATPCFHVCRYCQLRTPKAIPADFKRYSALIDRFIDWKEATGRHDFTVAEWYGNSHDYDRDVQAGVSRLSARQGDPLRVVLLGGTAHRPMAEMRHWLEDRRAVGIDTVVASFPGRAERHDYWNGKKGNYRFQLDTLHLAAEMGMRLQQRLFLIRDTISGFEALLDDLDAIQTTDFERWSYPLFYSGLARRLEAERLTELELDRLPPRIKATFRDDHGEWRSERRWIDTVREDTASDPEPVPLVMQLDNESLAWAEDQSCDAIVEELTARSRAAYAALPSRRELCERYGDPTNDKVYMFLGQMERVWLDRCRAENPGALDLRTTYFD